MSNYNPNQQDMCFICFESHGDIIRVCNCTGTNNGVHRECLNKWLEQKKINYCMTCKYKYKYDYFYKPSYQRLKNKHLNCFKYDDISLYDSDEDEDLAEQQEEKDFLFSILDLFFFLPINLIFCIALADLGYILINLFWILLFLNLTLIFYFYKIDLIYQPIITFRNIEIVLTIFVLICSTIVYSKYETHCYKICSVEKKMCDGNCTYYSTYQNSKIYRSDVIYTKLYHFIFIISLDFFNKLKDFLFIKRLAKFEKKKRRMNIFCKNRVIPINN